MYENPLLDFSELPHFSEIKPEHVNLAINELIEKANVAIEGIMNSSETPSWNNFIEPLTDVTERIERAWGVVHHMYAVINTPELRKAYNDSLPLVTAFQSELGQNIGLYNKYKSIAQLEDFETWPEARKATINNAIRDFRLSGAELNVEDKKRLSEIDNKLAFLAAKFSENVLDTTDSYALFINDKTKLDGVPNDILYMWQEAAKAEGKEGWKITLHAPSFLPLMQFCANRDLREEVYKASVTRASEFGPSEKDNSPIIRERLKLIKEKASLLAFNNYAELSLATKMADSPEEVIIFLRDLASKSKLFALKDRRELEDFAFRNIGLNTLEAWDISYVSEKLRLENYSFSDDEVKQYFKEDNVLSGLFETARTLYDIEVKSVKASTWHPDVRYYELYRNGKPFAGFYMDLYAREGKRQGAWMDSVRGRRVRDSKIQTPVAYVNTNFSGAVGGKPALFTHAQVTTLFHEFGHALQHLMTTVDELAVSGINGVEWDAVELASQIMENFCWEWDIVKKMSCHVESGAQLPRDLFDKMLSAKNFQSAMFMARQLEFGLFDMLLHVNLDPVTGNWNNLLDEVRKEVAVNIPPAYNRFPNTFSHIFAGGYAAGYYSYKWAEVLSADAYSAFEEEGGANPKTGKRFLLEFLSRGGSRPAIESFKAFRGREPKIDALLRHNGFLLP